MSAMPCCSVVIVASSKESVRKLVFWPPRDAAHLAGDYLRLLEALPNFAAPSKLSKNCSRYTVAGSAAGGGACRYPDVVRQVLL